MSEFSNRFRELKDRNKLTLKDLSEKLDIKTPNLSYYMNGREPNYDTLIKIANYFNVTTDWLIGHQVEVSNLEEKYLGLMQEYKILKEKIAAIEKILLMKD